ncbi:MAG TPA: type II secretion system protein GspG [Candidatus Acidoferrales bacterium]|nr:type II secretion system protein GspG [Candidatus Acidoferrales bacterium]
MKILRGFTLIELLVVLGILGILAAALLATINPVAQLEKSNDARRKADLESIQHALELYYQDTGGYPASSGSFQIFVNGSSVNWGSSWSPYITTLPKDPLATNKYVYYSPAGNAGQSYYLYANLQRGKNDPNVCNNGNACQSLSGGGGFPGAAACGGTCNYGVSSPNVSP